MIENFQTLLKEAVSGNEKAIETILTYFKEQAVSNEESEQAHLYLKRASLESHYAIYLRGILYEYGYGVKQDVDMSFLLMREAASKGNAKATYEVARHFLYGLSVQQNYQNALEWLKMASGSPHYIPEAMYELGRLYEQGLGVSVDLSQAKEWYEKAAKKGLPQAKETLAKH